MNALYVDNKMSELPQTYEGFRDYVHSTPVPKPSRDYRNLTYLNWLVCVLAETPDPVWQHWLDDYIMDVAPHLAHTFFRSYDLTDFLTEWNGGLDALAVRACQVYYNLTWLQPIAKELVLKFLEGVLLHTKDCDHLKLERKFCKFLIRTFESYPNQITPPEAPKEWQPTNSYKAIWLTK